MKDKHGVEVVVGSVLVHEDNPSLVYRVISIGEHGDGQAATLDAPTSVLEAVGGPVRINEKSLQTSAWVVKVSPGSQPAGESVAPGGFVPPKPLELAVVVTLLDAIQTFLRAHDEWNNGRDGGEDSLHYAAEVGHEALKRAGVEFIPDDDDDDDSAGDGETGDAETAGDTDGESGAQPDVLQEPSAADIHVLGERAAYEMAGIAPGDSASFAAPPTKPEAPQAPIAPPTDVQSNLKVGDAVLFVSPTRIGSTLIAEGTAAKVLEVGDFTAVVNIPGRHDHVRVDLACIQVNQNAPQPLAPQADAMSGVKINDYVTERARVLRINAPAWFKRPDFMAFVRSPGVATWHTAVVGEYSDTFIAFDSDSVGGGDPGLPDDIAAFIDSAIAERSLPHGVVWLSNLEM